MLDGGITALILTFNEEANLGRVLDRLAWADRVVVLDSFSTDRTLDVARSYPNVDVHQRAFDSFAGQCNWGLGLVETEWVLSLDADYVLTPELVREVAALPPRPDVAGYEASFTYVVGGRPLRGTLYPARTVLYRRDRAAYRQDGHAHRVEVDGTVRPLVGKVLHDDRKPLASWLDAQRRYAAQEAAKLRATPPEALGRNDRLRLGGSLAPVLAPLYALLVKGGALDGRAGWHYALQRAYAEVLLALHLHEAPPAAPPAPTSAAPALPSSPDSTPMYVLGINAYHGDVSAVLLRDGAVVAALEEERFTRIKHYAGFPTQAIRRCLEMAGIDGAEVAHVAISRDPKANLPQKALFALKKRPSVKLVLDRLKNQRAVREVEGPLATALGVDRKALPQIHNVEHHPAHLASAFFCSPFDEAAVAAIDGFGDFVSTSLAVGRGNQIEVLDRTYFPHSLGMLYTAVTQHLGFLHYGDEFKVMGLAPYGRPTRVDEVRQLVHLERGGTFTLNLDYFRHWSDGVEMEWDEGYPTLGRVYADKMTELLGPARDPDDDLTQHHEDLAHSLQVVYEEAAFHILRGLYGRTGQRKLCLAGGCGMNSVANGKIRANTPFEEVYIQPAAGDNGTALGAALWVWHQELENARGFVMDHAYWGTEYPGADVEAILDAAVPGRTDDDWRYTATVYGSPDETVEATADLLADGHVIGWFQGRMEWGSRALGNRSILADPSRADMRDLINLKIKFRERFRPFAPSILEERLEDYFVDPAPDPFMQQVYPVEPDKREGLPAITHVDGSGRLQTVAPDENPLYHQLIGAFAERTGTPILLNTSFNENEPIVDTPEQAFACFHRTRMDAVVIGNTIVQRVPVKEPVAEGAE